MKKRLQLTLLLLLSTFVMANSSHYNLASECEKKGDYHCAFEHSQNQLEEDLALYTEKSIQIANDYISLSYYARYLKMHKKALAYRLKVLEIHKNILGITKIDIADDYSNIGSIYADLENYDLGLEYYLKALAIQKETSGHNHPLTALAYNHVGSMYIESGKYSDALPYYFKDLEITKKYKGSDDPSVKCIESSIYFVQQMMKKENERKNLAK